MPTKNHRAKSILSRDARDRFLRALMECGTIRGASIASAVDRSGVYSTMRAEPDFKAAVEEAKALGVEAAKDEAYDRAMDRMDRASHILLMFLIKQADPSYRDSYRAPEDDSDKVSLRDVINAIRPEPDAGPA